MHRYDPEHAPIPTQWLALDEQIRIDLAEEYHRAAHIKLPKLTAHAVFHAIVENQIAEGLEPVVCAMARLRTQGLTRHDAIHAIAWVVLNHIGDILDDKIESNNIPAEAEYEAAVRKLSAKSWRKQVMD